jgi:hypothetical protein
VTVQSPTIFESWAISDEKENNKIIKNVVNLFITPLLLVNSVPMIIKKPVRNAQATCFYFLTLLFIIRALF